MKLHKISDFLLRKKDIIEIEDEKKYKRLTIKTKNQGVCLRDEEVGLNIGTKKQFIAKGGQFIVSKIDAMNGAFGIIPDDIEEAIITGNFWTYEVDTELVNIEWFNMFVSLPSFIKLCDKLSSGTTHRKYLDENKFSNYELFLPSIEEQNIIVKDYIKNKVLSDDLLYEISKQEKYISSLRQAVLQQAVEGKLCEQDPTDEPASVLLEKIKAEKAKLVADKKIKKQKELSPITEEEKPFTLPQGWEWCRLDNICTLITDGDHLPPPQRETGIPFVVISNINKNNIDFNNIKYVEENYYNNIAWGRKPEKGDILFTVTGSYGIPIIVKKEYLPFCFQRHIAILKLNILQANFLQKWLMSYLVKNQCDKKATGIAQKTVSLGTLREIIVPLPPLVEQQRIVEKVDRLMALCDELEQEVLSAKKYASQLMEAVLQEAFSGAEDKTQNNVIKIAPRTKEKEDKLFAAARGKIKESTWNNLMARAKEIAGEEDLWTGRKEGK